MRFLHNLQKGNFKCPHKGCKREFDKPTVITNSSKIPRETYYACPYCHSKLEIVTKDDPQAIGVNTTQHPKVFYLPAEGTHGTPQMEEQNTVEILPNNKTDEKCSDNEIAFMHENQDTSKEKTDQFSKFQCSHHFGYLGEKNKNESIPETCFECPRSIDCMLSEFNKSQESLTEIKKWYS